MNADRVDILDEAYCDYVVLSISYNFELELFPTADGLFYEYLVDHGSCKASLNDSLKLIDVINEAAACAAHCVSRSDNYRVAEIICDLDSFLNRVCFVGSGHLDSKGCHCLLELDSVFASLDSINLDTDNLNAVLFEDSGLCKLGAEVEA